MRITEFAVLFKARETGLCFFGRGGMRTPAGVQDTKKKPVLSYELFLKYGGEGGIDSLRSPFGQIPR
ncbi:hypothetical protein NPS48_22955, partial [Leclercia pneumoniae]|nr:hypothetical protein [Leclercia pneumoniae]